MGLLCLFFQVSAQNRHSNTALKIGDQFPDITITSLVNYPEKQLKTSDFNNRLLILDFWATWCFACVQKFPEDYQIQKKYGDKVQILLVDTRTTKDSKQKIIDFFDRHSDDYKLPSVYDDTVLTHLFPHFAIPHYVWIYKGKITAISGGDELNDKNVSTILSGGKSGIRPKALVSYYNQKPLFVSEKEGEPFNYLYRSVLTNFSEGIGGGQGFGTLPGGLVNRIFNINCPIFSLYQQAFPQFRGFSKNRIIYQGPNSTDFAGDSSSFAWKSKHFFIYEATFPARSVDQALKLMQEDLDRFFPYHLFIQSREADALVILHFKDKIPVADTLSEASTNIYDKTTKQKFLKNLPLTNLVSQLNNIQALSVIDETGFSGNLNITLPADLKDLKLVKSELEKQGFQTKFVKRTVNFLIVSDHRPETSGQPQNNHSLND